MSRPEVPREMVVVITDFAVSSSMPHALGPLRFAGVGEKGGHVGAKRDGIYDNA